jgi:arylsulfatase A-like enzyme
MAGRIVFLVALLVGSAVAGAAERAKPDVLVLLTDQWNPRYLSWDNPQVKTPNLDRIAREGMIFDACYTTSPVCMPARVSLITGLYPHNQGHAIWGNATSYFATAEAATMFRDIRAAGYTTAQIGKTHWTSGPEWKRAYKSVDDYHRALGLDYVVDVPGPPASNKEGGAYVKYLRSLGKLDAVADDMRQRFVEFEFEPRASFVPPAEYHDSFVTGAAVDYIRAQTKDQPLCLVVSLHSPHPPLDAPGEFATMYDPEKLALPDNVPETFRREDRTIDKAELRKILASYLGKISLVDYNVGRLIEAFEARGTWDDTLVVFTADHGEMMGSHGALTKGRFYDESVRVPLVVRRPGQVKSGRSDAPVQMFDVYPTIVEAIGGELSPGRFAKSLLGVATGKAKSVRDVAVSEIGDKRPLKIMARSHRYKYWADEDREFLFDLKADPGEMKNLADDGDGSEALNDMRRRLLTFLRSTQTNLAEGYKPKVQRLREAEEAAKKAN